MLKFERLISKTMNHPDSKVYVQRHRRTEDVPTPMDFFILLPTHYSQELLPAQSIGAPLDSPIYVNHAGPVSAS